MRPVETRLIASEVGAMTADVEYEVRCETAGAQPAAVVSWWINGNIRLKDFVNEVSENDGGIRRDGVREGAAWQGRYRVLL